MWSTIASLKENISQIANDVLDTADELETGLSPKAENGHGQRDAYANGEKCGADNLELQWYRNEVKRLSANDSDIQALSTNFTSLLKEREAEVKALKEQNTGLREQLAQRSAQVGGPATAELRRLEGEVQVLKEELRKASISQQERLAAVQAQHRSEIDTLNRSHSEELSQATRAHPPAQETSSENGVATGHSQIVLELQKKLKDVLARETAFAKNAQDKLRTLNDLQTVHEETSSDLGLARDELEQKRTLLAGLQSDLANERKLAEGVRQRCADLESKQEQLLAQVAAHQHAEEQQAKSAAKMEENVKRLESNAAQLQEEKAALERVLSVSREEVEKLHKEAIKPEPMSAPAAADEAGESFQALLRTKEDEARVLAERVQAAEAASAKQQEEFSDQVAKLVADRDKAMRDLERLKQHLLDKAEEESEREADDTARIAALEARASTLEQRTAELTTALARAEQELQAEKDKAKEGVQRNSEEAERLQSELDQALVALDAKDSELDNLQSALGQYYAEVEVKERVQAELQAMRDELAHCHEDIQELQGLLQEKENQYTQAAGSLSSLQSKLTSAESVRDHLQEEVSKLRRALEQSMTRIHRLSSDSDQLVDRRIVIKLLVTFFEKGQSREVLDLMTRMLGFSEEDKKRVGMAKDRAEGRGLIRGVLGMPGRLVGAVVGGGSAGEEPFSPNAEGRDQSFTDLWIDFLLKESQQQEQQRQADAARAAAEKARREEEEALGKDPPSHSQPPPFTNPTFAFPTSPSGSGALPGVYDPSRFSSGASPIIGVATPEFASRRKSSILEDTTNMNSPGIGSGYNSGGEFSPVPLNTSTPQGSWRKP